MKRTMVYVGRLILLAAVYYGTGRLGLALPYTSSNITLVWPPTGIALAALVRWGLGIWPGIGLGAFLIPWSIGSPLPVAAAITVGNTLGPVLAAWLLGHIDFWASFERKYDVFSFLLCLLIGMTIPPTVGVLALWWAGSLPETTLLASWVGWWLGDTIGAVVFGTPLLTWRPAVLQRALEERRLLELLVVGLGLTLVSLLVFVLPGGFADSGRPLSFIPFPFLVWAALRHGPFVASLAAMLLSCLAVAGLVLGTGPFVHDTVHLGLASVWAYMVTASLIALLITALQAQTDAALTALRASEERLQAILDQTPALVYVKDLHGRYQVVNQPFDRLIATACGKTDHDLFPPPQAAILHANDEKVLAAGRALEFEEVVHHADGVHTYLSVKFPMRDPQGQVQGLCGISTDITRRKMAEEALRSAQRFLEKITALLPVFLYVFDLDRQRTVYRNRAAQDFFGANSDDPDLLTLLDRIHPDDQPRFHEHLAHLREAPDACALEFEFRMRRVDGTWAWVISREMVFTRNATGKVEQIIGSGWDVTDRRRAEEALQASEQMLQTVINNIPIGVFWKDRDSRYLGCNRLVSRSLGNREPEEVIGRFDRDFPCLSPEQIAFFVQKDREVMASGTPEYGIIEPATLADGSTIWMETCKVPLRDRGGAIIGILGIWQDVTRRKQAEESLRQSEQRLRHLVEHLPVGAVHLDKESLFLNRAAEQLIGYARDEVTTPAAWFARLHPDRAEEVRHIYEADRAAGFPQVRTLPLRRKDGTTRFVEFAAYTSAQGEIWVLNDVTERKHAREALQRTNRLLQALSRSQARFISESDPTRTFDEMLATLLDVTGSAYGFIGEVLHTPTGQPYLKTHAISNIAWDEASRAFYAEHAPNGMEFTNVHSLFGAVLTTGRAVIANDPLADPRRGGLPDGHPPLEHFLGLPFHRGSELVGMVGVANRPGGYDQDVIRRLEPFLYTCANLIVGMRNEQARRQAEERIREALHEKEALLKEVHHRVKNNLQIITSLVNLQAAEIRDETVLAVFSETRNRVRSMALVHEMLYQTENLARIDVEEYISTLCAHLFRSYGTDPDRVRLVLEVDEVAFSVDQAIPCGLLISELVSNALKYAFPGGRRGTLTIRLEKRQEGAYTLTICDDGIGLPSGEPAAQPTTLGLRLVRDLARQLQGSFDLDGSHGTTFRMTFRP